jgi:hypothetical protein
MAIIQNNRFWEELIAYVPDTTRTAVKTTPPIILLCRGNVFSELLQNNDTRSDTQTDGKDF